MSALIGEKEVNWNELFCLVNYQSVVFWSELDVVVRPEFGVAKKIKINKKLFVRGILVVNCHQRLN